MCLHQISTSKGWKSTRWQKQAFDTESSAFRAALFSEHSCPRELVNWGFVCYGGIRPLNLLSPSFGEAIPVEGKKHKVRFQTVTAIMHSSFDEYCESYPLNLFVADRCSLGETKEGFWYRVAPPRDPLKMRIGIRT